jgi:hypothetical protein
MAKKAKTPQPVATSEKPAVYAGKPSSLLDTRVGRVLNSLVLIPRRINSAYGWRTERASM